MSKYTPKHHQRMLMHYGRRKFGFSACDLFVSKWIGGWMFFRQDSLISEGSFINFASWAVRYLLSGERGWRWGRVGVYRLEAAVVQRRQVQVRVPSSMFDYWLVFMVVIYKHCGIIFSVPSHFVFLTQCRRAVSESVNDSFHYDIQHWNCFL